jgi:hypothetical protein
MDPVGSEMWLLTKRSQVGCAQVQPDSGAQSAKYCVRHTTAARTGKLANLCKAQQIGDRGFAPPVFVRSVRMQPIATASRFQVDEGRREIVAAEEPGKGPLGIRPPFRITVRAPSGKAGRDRRRGFERLLIELERLLASGTETV